MEPGKRHTNLIANFVNGYAEGWYMAVKESCRNELDIKYTERKKNKQSFFEWTQGPYYSFAEGHLFYDTQSGYKQWDMALRTIKTCCKIVSAKPTDIKNKMLVEGVVVFTIYKPDEGHKALKTVKEYELSQTEFVEFLKTGLLNERAEHKSE